MKKTKRAVPTRHSHEMRVELLGQIVELCAAAGSGKVAGPRLAKGYKVRVDHYGSILAPKLEAVRDRLDGLLAKVRVEALAVKEAERERKVWEEQLVHWLGAGPGPLRAPACGFHGECLGSGETLEAVTCPDCLRTEMRARLGHLAETTEHYGTWVKIARWLYPDEAHTIPVRLVRRIGDRPSLTFAALQKTSVERCEKSFFPLAAWSGLEWAGAAAGELGEAANKMKKLSRAEIMKTPTTVTIKDLAAEMADTVAYLVLWAARMHIDLGAAVVRTFNEKSREIGSDIFLDAVLEKEDA